MRMANLRELEEQADAEIERLGGWPDSLGRRRIESSEADTIAKWASALGFGSVSQPDAALGGPRVLIEKLMVPMIKNQLPKPLRELLDHRILIRAAPLKGVNASAQSLPSGVLILINAGLPLLLFRIIGHAFALIETSAGETRGQEVIRVCPPTSERLCAVAGSVLMFAHPEIDVSLDHMPKPGPQGSGGTSAFGKILFGAEHFVIGHEIGHAIVHHLGMTLSEVPGIRRLVEPLSLPIRLKERWIRELTADVWGVTLTRGAKVLGDRPAPHWPDIAGAACLVALQVLELLEWVFRIPSSLSFPARPDPKFPLGTFGDHPPADLRLHVTEQVLRHQRLQSLEIWEPYRVSIGFLVGGLAREATNGCIAPNDGGTWPCRAPRRRWGWLCEKHSPSASTIPRS